MPVSRVGSSSTLSWTEAAATFLRRRRCRRDVSLSGSALLEEGVLQLTPAMHHNLGSLIVNATDETGTNPWPWASFDLRMRVYIGGGELMRTFDERYKHKAVASRRPGQICGGEGFTISYGPLPAHGLGLQGGGSGLRVAFETGVRFGPSILITYDNVQLARHDLSPSGGWLRGRWVALRVGYLTHDSQAGLVIERDDATDLRDFAVPGFAPERDWQLAISANTGLAVDKHLIDDLTLVTDALIAPVRTNVEVTLNGQQYTSDPAALMYARRWQSRASAPPAGPPPA